MKGGNEVNRARHAAIRAFSEYIHDKQRSVTLLAVEIRLNGPAPDVTYHIASGTLTQGGYLFFAKDLEPDVVKPKTIM